MIGVRNLCKFRFVFFLGHFDVLRFHDRFQHESALNSLDRFRLHLRHKGLRIQTGELEVLINGEPLLLQSCSIIIGHLAGLRLDHGLRNLHLGIRNDRRDHRIFLLPPGVVLFLLRQLLLHAFSVFVKRLEFGHFRCELIVEFRKFLDLDLIDFYLKNRFFSF